MGWFVLSQPVLNMGWAGLSRNGTRPWRTGSWRGGQARFTPVGVNLVRAVPKVGVKYENNESPIRQEMKPSACVARRGRDEETNIFCVDDAEDGESKLRLKPNLLSEMINDNSREGYSDMTLLRRPNASRRKIDRSWRGGFSLGIDLGLSRTGLALSKGFSVRPLSVLNLRGQKLELRIMEIAEEEEVDEFIIGLPKSSDGKETIQSNKVRSVAGRLSVRAAERGWRVYVLDEHGTSSEASDRMIVMGLGKGERQRRTDAYAAVILLERYFSTDGEGTEIILPKSSDLQEKLKKGVPLDPDFFPENLEENFTF